MKALTDPECSIEFKPIGQWLAIFVCRPKQEHLVAVFDNITGRKEVEQALRNRPTERWQCDTDVGVGSTGTVAFSV